ncbi:MAG TPA: glycosyltransferase [Blastocatellia bacterium]|nr:glycosyltransferase [Blastocatellia bacterium]
MANILFMPVPEFGHMNPPLKLAKSLQQRGHRVYYIGFSDFEDYVRAQGLDYISIFKDRYPKGYLAAKADKQASMKTDRLSLLFMEARARQDRIALDPLAAFEEEVAQVFQAVPPDLFLVDNMLRDLAASVAHHLGVPTVRLSLHFEEARVALAERGRTPPPEKLPAIILCPKEFDFVHSPMKENYHYLEASIEVERKEFSAFPWEKLDDSRPLIYCSFGSQCHQYKQSEALFGAIIEAVGERPQWQLVLAVGPYLKAEAFAPLPDNVLVVNWAPQLKLLERAAVMITHGGLGAVKECIFFAVPMVVFPGNWDQPYHAARVAHHGIGLRGNSHGASVRDIQRMLDAVMGDVSFRRRVEAMSRTFRDIEDSGIGVRTVEQLMADLQGQRAREAAAPDQTQDHLSGQAGSAARRPPAL